MLPSSSFKDFVGDGSVGGSTKACLTLIKLFIFIFYDTYSLSCLNEPVSDIGLILFLGDCLHDKTFGD